VNIALVSVSGFMGSLKLAVTNELIATPVALAVGLVELTVGGVTSGATPVVKLQVNAVARLLPAASCAPVPICAVQIVLAGNTAAGVNVATLPLTAYPTVPETGEPLGQASVKIALVSVSASIDSLKLAVMSELMDTATALAAGLVELTVGAVTSGAKPVVKLQLNAPAIELSAASAMLVVSCATQLVLAGSAAAGVKVTTLPLAA